MMIDWNTLLYNTRLKQRIQVEYTLEWSLVCARACPRVRKRGVCSEGRASVSGGRLAEPKVSFHVSFGAVPLDDPLAEPEVAFHRSRHRRRRRLRGRSVIASTQPEVVVVKPSYLINLIGCYGAAVFVFFSSQFGGQGCGRGSLTEPEVTFTNAARDRPGVGDGGGSFSEPEVTFFAALMSFAFVGKRVCDPPSEPHELALT